MGIPAYQETARKRVYHELASARSKPISAEWLEQLCAHVEEGGKIGEPAALDLLCELIRLQFDLACRDGDVGMLYRIRKELGFNELHPLSHLDDEVRALKRKLGEASP